MVKSSRENLVVSDDADEIDQALEEAFTKEEVNEVHKEPEIEQPKVRLEISVLLTGFPSLVPRRSPPLSGERDVHVRVLFGDVTKFRAKSISGKGTPGY